MRKLLLFSFLFSFLFYIAQQAYAKSYYIGLNGLDSNPGTMSQPFKSLSKGLLLAQAGDSILFLPGKYLLQNLKDASVTTYYLPITKAGLPEKPIVIKSASTDPKQFATIDGERVPGSYNSTSTMRAGCLYLTSTASWINIENFNFQNCWEDVITIMGSSYITIRGVQALGGKHFAYGKLISHHILIENCEWQQDKRIWTEWGFYDSAADGGTGEACLGWCDIHHGSKVHFNGSFFDCKGGGAVIRNNTIKNAFNGIQMWSASTHLNNNFEIYNNYLDSIIDNAIEPETGIHNLHFYHNILNNINLGVFSYHETVGGPVYFYGNTGYHAGSPLANTMPVPVRIYKFSESLNPGEIHIYNNSFYYGQAFKKLSKQTGEYPFIRHYNNAYFHKEGDMGPDFLWVDTTDWKFDYDCSNKPWATSITAKGQESHGLKSTNPLFSDPLKGNFKLQSTSSCFDKGLNIPDFTQFFQGTNPDIGAYEGNLLVEGPPFAWSIPAGGLTYKDKPRVSRYRVNGNELRLFFSSELDPATVKAGRFKVMGDGTLLSLTTFKPGPTAREVIITFSTAIGSKKLKLCMNPLPLGVNGEQATNWASAIETFSCPLITNTSEVQLSNEPDQFGFIQVCNDKINLKLAHQGNVELEFFDVYGRLVRRSGEGFKEAGLHEALLPSDLLPGVYLLIMKVGNNKENFKAYSAKVCVNE